MLKSHLRSEWIRYAPGFSNNNQENLFGKTTCGIVIWSNQIWSSFHFRYIVMFICFDQYILIWIPVWSHTKKKWIKTFVLSLVTTSKIQCDWRIFFHKLGRFAITIARFKSLASKILTPLGYDLNFSYLDITL